MNIEEFISEALQQIGAGVSAASKEKGIEVNPRPFLNENENTLAGHMITMKDSRPIVLVNFDLAVAVHSKIEGSAVAGLTVLGLGGKGEMNTGIDQTHVHRVKFHVPIAFKSNIQT
jgi:hypothetical protein